MPCEGSQRRAHEHTSLQDRIPRVKPPLQPASETEKEGEANYGPGRPICLEQTSGNDFDDSFVLGYNV